ncbi:hypothetical protein CLAFUW4_09698 [Fulvia fulva]|uniref:DUF1772-domain-containing protein n=1 Tax=Passalora fulva TaxID=5499 RepID=A0A9Q8PGK4_PASFU|nr:uncharacterized protein CLAFUR5_09791 [Fulvia fulva]KAK4613268.1 hypothetical protein CLAFUR4_09703 [Fulvia fulva]KAK4615242.1 hypothetical protein CLAFUR0_09694 [Fulvia fulva]UJO22022.1 hypothetical protein CLAFUR5_09791 [Fulvia fulva]WPV19926.1 hypothetical protein CLAFUW4_09698 [Fulvia fulva]WPV35391.1 hypothetical protein CLAFUW7_09699 [Fulvia fulva]
MATQLQQLVPFAQVLGLSGASALSAYIASFSLVGVPVAAMAPTDLATKQWLKMFHIGKNSVPPLAAPIAACFAFLAYQARDLQKRYLYGAAAILPLTIPAFTGVVMWSGIKALEAAANGSPSAPSDAEVKSLLAKWSTQNLGRAILAGAAAALGATAMLS